MRFIYNRRIYFELVIEIFFVSIDDLKKEMMNLVQCDDVVINYEHE